MNRYNKILFRIILLLILFLLIGGSIFYTLRNVKFEESIASILPADEENKFLVELLDSASFFDRMVFHIYHSDSAVIDPNELTHIASMLTDSIEEKFIPTHIKKIEGRIDPSLQLKLIENFFQYLPIYMEKTDYKRIDSLIYHGNMNLILQEHLKLLNSPAGMMASRFIFRDPFGLASAQMKRLKELQLDKNLTVRGNFLITNDQKHILFFVTPVDAKNTGHNEKFIQDLDKTIKEITALSDQEIRIDYIGSLPIATANANRIRKDIQLTVSLAVIIIILLIFYYFRSIKTLGYILLPAVFGASTALFILSFLHTKLSIIALGIGSVLLGITVDYALHLLTHLKRHGRLKQSVKKVTIPIALSSITTATAFFCLLLLSSESMRQLGLFAGISVLSAAVLTIFFLPAIIPDQLFGKTTTQGSWIERAARFEIKHKALFITILVIISGVLFVFSRNAGFEKDIEKSNYMPANLLASQNAINKVSAIHQKHIYLLSGGKDLNQALNNLYIQVQELKSLKEENRINEYHGVYSLLFSEEKQAEKIEQWNKYWTSEKIRLLKTKLDRAGKETHFKTGAFKGFYQVVEKDYSITPPEELFESFSVLIKDYKITLADRVLIPTIIPVSNVDEKAALTENFNTNPAAYVLDRKDFFLKIFESVQVDFNKLIRISLLLVFLIILFSLGRIELAVITYIPIILSWVWTLGIMGLTGLKINYFNIVICTLIFGLGVDYSIFITNGLIQKYKYGHDDLVSFRSSILISVLTTLTGLGVLIFAKHPALRSIAGLAIVGISSVVIISFTLQPILFNLLVNPRRRKNKIPHTFLQIFYSIYFYASFVSGSLVLTLLVPVIYILPFRMPRKRSLMRALLTYLLRGIIRIHPNAKVKRQNIEKSAFNSPGILISNHQSMIDILVYLSLSPRILILTKDWVWNNPFYGLVVRFCGHINISPGYDKVLDVAQKRISEGCSILVFPEGSRSSDGTIKRFHKGGFYLAQQLKLPVHIFLVHGAWFVLPRDTFIIQKGIITIKIVTTISIDPDKERAYYFASKDANRIMREAFVIAQRELETPKFFRHKIIGNYLYKGPILENYVRAKLRLEKNYEAFHQLIPEKCSITDIGCGYGTIDFMLSLVAPERNIVAIDYDSSKIELAKNSILNGECSIDFIACDILSYKLFQTDIILISDMLHYLPGEKQLLLLSKCSENLNPGGKIIIRDSDTSLKQRQKGTSFSEFLSTRIGFNKTQNKLNFFSRHFIEQFAVNNNLSCKIQDQTRFTSNLIYILQKNKNEREI
jgi:uncharacterized protein